MMQGVSEVNADNGGRLKALFKEHQNFEVGQ
jgi:hypothetical protein